MAYTTRWVAGGGQGLTYGAAGFTATDFNSLADGSTVVAASAIANGTALDIHADVSFSVVVGGTTVSTSHFNLYLLPLNQDGTTYGDAAATGATPPSASYLVSSVGVKSGVTSGNAVVGTFRDIVLPPGSFKFAVQNSTSIALNSAAAAVVSYRTYDENLNA
jgi:hypothetical protein